MTKILPYTGWILAIGLGMVCFVSIRTCNENKIYGDQYKTISDYENNIIDSFDNTKKQIIVVHDAAQSNDKHLVDSLAQALFNEKKVNLLKEKQVEALTIINGKFSLDTIIQYVHDTLPVPLDTNLIRVPKKVFVNTKDYLISATVERTGLAIDSILIPDSLMIKTVVLKSANPFKPNPIQVQVLNTNSHISVQGVNAIILHPKPTAWSYIWKVIILIGGIFIGTKI